MHDVYATTVHAKQANQQTATTTTTTTKSKQTIKIPEGLAASMFLRNCLWHTFDFLQGLKSL